MTLWIARLSEQRIPYGPFADQAAAIRFAAYLAAEVDPAEVERLRDPVAELLAWHDQQPDWHDGQPAPAGTAERAPQPIDASRPSPAVTRADGHAAGCLRGDPHFFPRQCR